MNSKTAFRKILSDYISVEDIDRALDDIEMYMVRNAYTKIALHGTSFVFKKSEKNEKKT